MRVVGGKAGSDDEIVWRPTEQMVAASNLTAFMKRHGVADFDQLLIRSDRDPEWFWTAILEGVTFQKAFDVLCDKSRGREFATWCKGGTTNIVLNCIERHRGTPTWTTDSIVHEAEDGAVTRWTYERLADEVDALANGLRAIGCRKGEVIGLYLPSVPEAFAAFLAIAKIGGIVLPLFSGFGSHALATRLADAEAATVITSDATKRRGKRVDLKAVVDEAAADLPRLKRVVVLATTADTPAFVPGRDYDYQTLVQANREASPIEEMDADAHLMLMYTSGTTGKPKGTLHTHAGFLAKLSLDMSLMLDLKPTDRLLWISDMGWLVGPIIVVATTFVGASALIVEGGPDYPDPGRMWRLVDDHGVTFLGLAPTTARAFMKAGGAGVETRTFESLRILASTGEVWTPDAWHWVLENVSRHKVPILNYSGGTEIGGGILTGTVLHPMKPCAFTTAIPGMQADIVDDTGASVPAGTVGELVLREPSIGLSRSLWRDDARYLESYWEALPGFWKQGDWAVRDAQGFWYIRGRSDDTLKIAGKRTGPAEVEGLLTATGMVTEAAVIGVPHPVKGQAVGCLVVLMPGIELTDGLREKLESAVIEGLGAPYRPAFILPVPDLPKTRNMKIMRRAVRSACLGHDPGDLSSLVNPQSVDDIATAMRQSGHAHSIGG